MRGCVYMFEAVRVCFVYMFEAVRVCFVYMFEAVRVCFLCMFEAVRVCFVCMFEAVRVCFVYMFEAVRVCFVARRPRHLVHVCVLRSREILFGVRGGDVPCDGHALGQTRRGREDVCRRACVCMCVRACLA